MDRPLDYKEHLAAVGDNYKQLMEELVALGQNHIFEQWPAPGTDDDKKEEMMKQLEDLDKKTPGGLIDYIKRSTDLLEKAQKGGNNLKGFVPSVPTGERLKVGDEKFRDMEITGMTEAAHSAFVLVAGGLGERLGFGGIKVSLPSEVVTEKPFLQLYAEHILALQARAREGSGDRSLKLPLAIMTSGDTHQRTVDLLEANDYFGLDKDQVTLLEQQKVPAMNNKNAHLALDPENPYRILTKPHGHGDVHTLLHQSGTAKKWASEGRRWVVFFQDTNGLIFQAVPALIGVSKRLELEVNTLTVPRRPGEAVGSICHLKNNENGKQLTVNVEYNQLEGLLKSTVSPEGDVPSPETGYSPYPGNTNALVFRVEPYVSVLEKTGGLMPEFVNPKFKDDARVTFKKPTRLECMMQDYPLLLERDARVGFTQLERWACFASAKNNAADAASQFEKTGFAESASTAEAAIYDMFAQKLRRHGANVEEGEKVSFNGVPTLIGPKIILAPSFSTSYDELCRKFVTPEKVSISKSSTLYLDGRDIEVKSLDLDGTLSVKAVPGAHVVIDGLKIENKGWPLVSVDANDKSVSEKLRIRGYTIDRVDEEKVSYVFDKPGEYSLP
eukprot:CAMPEP_0167763760 /NCGR_PEP_ID=MMETSP0110_2-20121227/13587_1 /TAXON_ID=629695 /ORGANISM="Gymnochlora sp., Strain CCMP2014" /LENGTH=611 /DNA_ID=CAMNT_0007650951 /DNA_START=239 /DNA_END=2074 /DNA_ORIENTATION=+